MQRIPCDQSPESVEIISNVTAKEVNSGEANTLRRDHSLNSDKSSSSGTKVYEQVNSYNKEQIDSIRVGENTQDHIEFSHENNDSELGIKIKKGTGSIRSGDKTNSEYDYYNKLTNYPNLSTTNPQVQGVTPITTANNFQQFSNRPTNIRKFNRKYSETIDTEQPCNYRNSEIYCSQCLLGQQCQIQNLNPMLPLQFLSVSDKIPRKQIEYRMQTLPNVKISKSNTNSTLTKIKSLQQQTAWL